MKSTYAKTNKAFTIIELLIVIVIIGVLVAITAVSYTGIARSAQEASYKAQLKQASTQLALASAQSKELNTSILPGIKDGVYSLGIYPNKQDYCVSINPADSKLTPNTNLEIQHINSSGSNANTIQTGACPKLLSCPVGYIEVPGNSHYGTTNFCVMKYEAKNVGGVATSQAAGTPWVSISQDTAKTTAATSGIGHHLITDSEWMTIAMNVINNPVNWSSGTVGEGFIYSGHNDNAPVSALAASTSDSDGYFGTGNVAPSNQKRTLILSNGEVIWDLAGNVLDWTDATITTGQPGLTGQATYVWNEYAANTMQKNSLATTSWPTGILYGATNGVGRLLSNPAETAQRSFIRGGTWDNRSDAGVLLLASDHASTYSSTYLGFRVAR